MIPSQTRPPLVAPPLAPYDHLLVAVIVARLPGGRHGFAVILSTMTLSVSEAKQMIKAALLNWIPMSAAEVLVKTLLTKASSSLLYEVLGEFPPAVKSSTTRLSMLEILAVLHIHILVRLMVPMAPRCLVPWRSAA